VYSNGSFLGADGASYSLAAPRAALVGSGPLTFTAVPPGEGRARSSAGDAAEPS